MTELDWSTPAGLAAIRQHLAGQLESWTLPVAWGVGVSSASSDLEWQFPHINLPGGSHALAAVVLATVAKHDGSTATLPLTSAHLEAAIEGLSPARACTEVEHPNLAAWQEALTEIRDNPAREGVAVFISDLDDPASSDADGSMRAHFEHLHPRT